MAARITQEMSRKKSAWGAFDRRLRRVHEALCAKRVLSRTDPAWIPPLSKGGPGGSGRKWDRPSLPMLSHETAVDGASRRLLRKHRL